MSNYDTPFKDKVASEMPFSIIPTGGNDPAKAGQVDPANAVPHGRVTPKELPSNQLFHGKGE